MTVAQVKDWILRANAFVSQIGVLIDERLFLEAEGVDHLTDAVCGLWLHNSGCYFMVLSFHGVHVFAVWWLWWWPIILFQVCPDSAHVFYGFVWMFFSQCSKLFVLKNKALISNSSFPTTSCNWWWHYFLSIYLFRGHRKFFWLRHRHNRFKQFGLLFAFLDESSLSLLLALVLLEHEVWGHGLTVGLYAHALITALHQTIVGLRNRTWVPVLSIMIWRYLSDTVNHITVLHLASQAHGWVDVAGVGWRILDEHMVEFGHRRRSVCLSKVNLRVCLCQAWVFSQHVIPLRCYYQRCNFVVFDMWWDIRCLDSVEGWLCVLVSGWRLLSQHVAVLACIYRNWLRLLLFARVVIVALKRHF